MLITHLLVIGEECLNSVKDFSVPHAVLPASRVGMGEKMGRETARRLSMWCCAWQ